MKFCKEIKEIKEKVEKKVWNLKEMNYVVMMIYVIWNNYKLRGKKRSKIESTTI